jgi:hypothetical protein
MVESIILFTTTDWISLFTAIAALITAIITLFTIREIKKQREHSYQPDLDIANFDVHVYKYDYDEKEDDKDLIFLYYSKVRLNISEKLDGYNELLLDINNIGFGAAKEVNWKWSFDFFSAKDIINLSENEFEYDSEKEEISINIPNLKIEWTYLLYEEHDADCLNFILPYSIENRENTLRLPSYFIDLFWLYKSKGVVNQTYASDQNFLPLKLLINYINIDGKKFEKHFDIHLRFHFISHPMTKEKYVGKFRFDIVKTK